MEIETSVMVLVMVAGIIGLIGVMVLARPE